MNLYRVTYKQYQSTGAATCAIVARTVTSALEEAKMFLKKKFYSDREITHIEKLSEIDRVARR